MINEEECRNNEVPESRKKADIDTALGVFDCFCETCKKHKGQETFVMDCPFCGRESVFEVIDCLRDLNGQYRFCRGSIHVKKERVAYDECRLSGDQIRKTD